MIIDGHAHACGDFLTAGSIVKKLNDTNVDKVILVPGELNSTRTYRLKDFTAKDPYKDPVVSLNRASRIFLTIIRAAKAVREGNEYVYSLKQQLPDRVIQFFWITKHETGKRHPGELLDEKYARMGFAGLKMHQNWESFKVGDPYFSAVMDWAENHNLPVFIHLYSISEVKSLAAFKSTRKNLKIIHAHLFGFEHIREAVRDDENYLFDLSSAYGVSQQRIKRGVETIGSRRFTLGSDTPYGLDALEMTIKRINSINLGNEEKERILGENLRAFLNVKQV